MRRLPAWTLLVACLGAWTVLEGPADAQVVGTTLRPHQIYGLRQTKAKSVDDYRGRLVLLEFFAHW